TLLPREQVAIEILEDVQIDAELITACKELKRLGYMIVLDDFIFQPKFRPLIELADIIKIDFLNNSIEVKNNPLPDRFNEIKLLAEKIETKEAFAAAQRMGYSYFQGYFFSKPIVLSTRDIPAYKLNCLRALKEINQPEPDLDAIAEIVKLDISLSYKLLKLVNSAAFGLKEKLSSVKQAMVLLGMRELKKWFTLILMVDIGQGKSVELITISIMRARFGELLAPMINLDKLSSDLFMLGLLSMIDVLLDRPMPEILADLSLSENITDTLLGKKSPLSNIYKMILSYEKGDWESTQYFANAQGIGEAGLGTLYKEALKLAESLRVGA
ncbi:MAG: EAL and HDOD domain-containing protein, partial [Bacillota bacterium]